MAELRGLILSLSRLHRSPRQLLIDADRIISAHLDDRSFITMTYAVVDLEARTLTYARAGHCPLIYRAGTAQPRRPAQVMTPDGLVLGLKIDGGERFASLLEEVTVPLEAGALFLLFTDGLTEAMNPDGDCFGEARLSIIVEEFGDAGPDALRERILREVHAFTGPAAPHDDMTMVLLQVGS
jgi:serine phosphatase RsbU (regulator of sigma subunit)